MAAAEEKKQPVRQSVHVDCPPEEAFRLFTEGFAGWWPLQSYSVAHEDSETCAIEPWEGGRVLERTQSGEEHEWGSVLKWDPPERVEFTWHPGAAPDDRQTVEVEFQVEAGGTRVTLTHRGWHLAGVASCSIQRGVAPPWAELLARCAEFAAASMLVIA